LDINSSAVTETEISMCLKKADAELMEELITKYKEETDAGNDKIIVEDINKDLDKDVENSANDNLSEMDVVGDDVNVYGLKKSEKSGATIGTVVAHCFYSMHFIPMIALSILFGIGAIFTADEEIQTIAKLGFDIGVVTIILVVISTLIAFLKQFLAYYDFKSYRENNTINISYGLFNKHTFRIPVNKINAVSISTSILGRICGRMYAQVKCVGVGDDEKEMSIITLSVTKKELHKRLMNLLPEFIPEEMKTDLKIEKNELNREPKSTKILYLIYVVLFMMLTVIVGSVALSIVEEKFYMVVAIAVCVLNLYFVIYTIGKYYTCGYLFLDEHAVLCEGVFSKKITIISHKSIEGIEISSGPIKNKLGICSGDIKIKASILDSVTSMCHIDVKHKDALIEGYLSKCRKSKV
jgi:putative membrane protein